MSAIPPGDLWFATETSGVYRLSDEKWLRYSVKDGLASDNILCSAAAPDRSVWFGTQSGISRFDGQNWTTVASNDNVGNNWVTASAVAPDGSIWFGYTGGIAHYIPGGTP